MQINHKPGFTRTSQPEFINHIINAIPGMDKENTKLIPMSTKIITTKYISGKERKETLNYRPLIGIFNCLVNTAHP